jgi:hypothetical protein
MSQDTVLREFRARRARYPRPGLLGTAPVTDVFNDAIDTLIDNLQQAEEMERRLREFTLPETLADDALSVCRQLAASASRHAIDLIDIRQKLLRRGINLGTPVAA